MILVLALGVNAALLSLPGLANSKVALIIGNGDYADSPLKNPINDANDMADTLGYLGFEVLLHSNLNRNQMNRAIREFGDKLTRAEIGLFYYAGHGMQVRGSNYLIPTGVDITSEDEVQFETVDTARILAKMEWARNPVNIIILDACRNNPFHRSFRSATRGLARLDSPVGSLLLYATAPSRTAADGEGNNGVFTGSLIKQLRQPGLSLNEVVLNTRVEVMKATQNQQVPWSSSSLTKRIVLLPEDEPLARVTQPESSPADLPQTSEPRDRISLLLEVCQAHLAANRLTAGVGGSALDCFQSVLRIDPYSHDALVGIDKITQNYIGRARSALKMGRSKTVQRYLETIVKINPEHPAVDELEIALEDSAAGSDKKGFVGTNTGANTDEFAKDAEEENSELAQLSNQDSTVVTVVSSSSTGSTDATAITQDESQQIQQDATTSQLSLADTSLVQPSSDGTVPMSPDPVASLGEKVADSEADRSSQQSLLQSNAINIDQPGTVPDEDVVATTESTGTEPDSETASTDEEDITIASAAPPRELCPDCNAPSDKNGNLCIELSPQPSILVPASEGNCVATKLDKCLDNEYRFLVRNICKKPMYVEWILKTESEPRFDEIVLDQSQEKLITCLKKEQGCAGTIRYSWKKAR